MNISETELRNFLEIGSLEEAVFFDEQGKEFKPVDGVHIAVPNRGRYYVKGRGINDIPALVGTDVGNWRRSKERVDDREEWMLFSPVSQSIVGVALRCPSVKDEPESFYFDRLNMTSVGCIGIADFAALHRIVQAEAAIRDWHIVQASIPF